MKKITIDIPKNQKVEGWNRKKSTNKQKSKK